MLEKMSRVPQHSINASFTSGAETVAAYRSLSNPKITGPKLLEGHREKALQRAADEDRVLMLQDTSQLDFTTNRTLEGAGALGNTKDNTQTGFFLHAHYLIGSRDHLPLGVWQMDFEARDPAIIGMGKQRKSLPIEEKSSFRWLEGYRLACQLQAELKGKKVVSISDREGDIFEIYAEHFQRSADGLAVADFIIRAKENRALLEPQGQGLLFDQDQYHAPLGTITFKIPSQIKRIKTKTATRSYQRPARGVTQEVRAYEVTPRPPQRRGKKLPVVKLWIVSAREIDPPEGVPPIHWTMITNQPINDLEHAREVLNDYLGRWGIEVFFRTLKTGCKVEDLLLKNTTGLHACIALYGIIAWRINFLSERVRTHGGEPCGDYFSEAEWRSTLAIAGKPADPQSPPTFAEFMTVVAMQGGYNNRKSDPPPGPQAIWQGLRKVSSYAEAWLAFGNRP